MYVLAWRDQSACIYAGSRIFFAGTQRWSLVLLELSASHAKLIRLLTFIAVGSFELFHLYPSIYTLDSDTAVSCCPICQCVAWRLLACKMARCAVLHLAIPLCVHLICTSPVPSLLVTYWMLLSMRLRFDSQGSAWLVVAGANPRLFLCSTSWCMSLPECS